MIRQALITIPMLALAFDSCAANSMCKPEMERRAELQVVNLANWSAVYKAYRKYSMCDDGAIGEGFSDSIGKLLEQNWTMIIELDKFTRNDNHFKQFVLKHIDETLTNETLQKIKENAKNRCPIKQIDLCRQIEKSITR